MRWVLLVLCGVLGGVLAYQWEHPPVRLPSLQPPPPADPSTLPGVGPGQGAPEPPTGLPPMEVFQEALDRPLFDETRRPAPPEDVAEVEAVPEAPPQEEPFPANWNLTGIWNDGSGLTAMFVDNASKDVQHLRIGDQLESWIVTAIRPDGVDMGLRSEIHEIPLRVFKNEPAKVVAQPRVPIRRPGVRRPPPVRRAPPVPRGR